MSQLILIVDDNEENRLVLEALFRGEGFRTVSANDGRAALAAARAERPDAIITDILMPVMDGYELCKEWNADPFLADVPFVFYTATYTDPRDEEFALSLGADRFLIKPQDPDDLLKAVKEVLASGHAHAAKAHPLGEEMEFFRKHNETLFRKLEEKMADLDRTNALLRLEMDERARAEKRIRKLAAAVERSPIAIVITDPSGTVEYANPVYCAASGLDPGSVLGSALILPEQKGKAPSPDGEPWNALRAGKPWHGEGCRKDVEGRPIHERAILSPVIDAEGRVTDVIAIIEDVTRQKKIEEELRRSQRMDELGQLAGGVAHDFNNILTAILGFSDAILLKAAPDDQNRPFVEEINKAAGRASKLTQTLLSFARKRDLKLEPVDLNAIVQDLGPFLKRIVPQTIQLRLSFEPGDLRIMADRGQIEQILMNLVTNARDAMPDGGALMLRTRRELDKEGTGGFAVLEVADQGMGMDEATRERIFEPFFTTKEEGKGTGLGLALVYGIVENHCGSVEVESEPGKGSTFSVRFPLIP